MLENVSRSSFPSLTVSQNTEFFCLNSYMEMQPTGSFGAHNQFCSSLFSVQWSEPVKTAPQPGPAWTTAGASSISKRAVIQHHFSEFCYFTLPTVHLNPVQAKLSLCFASLWLHPPQAVPATTNSPTSQLLCQLLSYIQQHPSGNSENK